MDPLMLLAIIGCAVGVSGLVALLFCRLARFGTDCDPSNDVMNQAAHGDQPALPPGWRDR